MTPAANDSLNRVVSTFNADKVSDTEWRGTCPACKHNSLIISPGDKVPVVAWCSLECDKEQVNSAVYKVAGSSVQPFTVARFCEMKKLPEQWVKDTFLVRDDHYTNPKTGKRSETTAPCFPYYLDATEWVSAGTKFRFAENSHKTAWGAGYKPALYGTWLFRWYAESRMDTSTVVLCEGESDTITLAYNRICALGISGAPNGWKKDFAKIPELEQAKRILVVQEPDDAGAKLVKRVAASFPDPDRVYALQLPAKDPSELWIKSTPEEFAASWKKAVEEARPALTESETRDTAIPCTDTGNAERLVKMHGQNFRWVPDEDTFRIWNGTVWQANKNGNLLLPQTKEVVRAITDPEWKAKSESAGKRNAMIAMAKGETSVWMDSDAFDKNPMLLNVRNGTLDLETEELRDFCREDFLTKRARVTYDPFATCPKFDDFLDFAFDGDKDTIHFILKALGYTLTGKTGESCFFICYGLGANGKTTLVEVMMQIMGTDFARPAKFSTFVSSKMHDPKYEIATFKGRRLITAIEPRKAGHLDEEVLKQLTGGDQIMARDIYKENVVFYPEFKLWLAMNNQPRILGTDDGIWRRVRLIPFLVKVPESRKIKEFHRVLFTEEGPGILNRLLEGLRAWREEGLRPSGAVARATQDFRAEQNVIQRFFEAVCLTDKRSYKIEAGKLYRAYQAWAEAENEYVIRNNEFSEEVRRRGCISKRGGSGTIWRGITLRANPEEGEMEREVPMLVAVS